MDYCFCPRAFYYQRAKGMKRGFIDWRAVVGIALHRVIQILHKEREYFSRPHMVGRLLEDCYFQVWESFYLQGIKVRGDGFSSLEPYVVMLNGYMARDENRKAEVLLAEASYRFAIKPFRTTYYLEGSIDQLRRNQDGTLELVEFKSGRRRDYSPFSLTLNYQLSIHAYALYRGEFQVEGDAEWRMLNLTPDHLSLYFLQDHLPYRRSGRRLDANKGTVVIYRKGEERGFGLYRTDRPLQRIRSIPKELGRVCAAIRRHEFYRRPSELCQKYCSFRDYCQAELGLPFPQSYEDVREKKAEMMLPGGRE